LDELSDEENIDANGEGFPDLSSISRIGVKVGGVGLIGAVCGDADAEEAFDFFFLLLLLLLFVLSITNLSTEESTITGKLTLLEVLSSQITSLLIFDSYLNAWNAWLEFECIEEGEAIEAFDEILPVFAVFFFGCLPSMTDEC